MRARWFFVLCAAALAVPAGAARGEPSKAGQDAARYQARTLAEEGDRLFQAGDYRGALARLREALARFKAPTIELAMAEAHEKLGELLAARALFERVAATALDPGAPAEFREAAAAAKEALARLEKAIPSLVIELVSGEPPVLALTLDGTALPTWDRPIRLDPGPHSLSIEMSGHAPESRKMVLKPGETKRIQLRWSRAAAPEPAPLPAPPPPPPAAPGRSIAAPVIAFSVGGAGLILGAAAGGVAISKMDRFKRECGPALQCPAAFSGELEGARAAGHVSTVGFAVAGAGAALGVLLLVVPAGKSAPASVAVGPSGVSLTTHF